MILALRTDSPTTYLAVLGDDHQAIAEETWLSERRLADELLSHIKALLERVDCSWPDLTGIVAYLGPGSFTGLRIGITTANALADSLNIPLSGGTGDDWLDNAIKALDKGKSFTPLMPQYGSEANITRPRS